MSVQTSVSAAPVAGVPGELYDVEFSTVESGVAPSAIPFGAWVVQKVAGEWVIPAAAGDITGYRGGVALIDQRLPTDQGGYIAGDSVRVMTEGKAFVLNEEALALGDTVFVRHGDGAGGTVEGSFRNDADTATAAEPQTTVKVAIAGAANLAVVQVG